MFCKICNKEINYSKFNFFRHLNKDHNKTTKEYYDLFFRKEHEGICYCGKETTFKNSILGYFKFCSGKCSNNSLEKKEKTIQKNLKNYGVKVSSQSLIVKEKAKNNNLKKYGVEYISQAKFFNDQVKKTNNENRLNRLNKHIQKNNLKLELLSCDKDIYKFKCLNCNNLFDITFENFYLRSKNDNIICTCCRPINYSILSNEEKSVVKYIKENYNGEIIENSKKIINPYEIDIYLPELKLAFEFNGLYWHNELNKHSDYHLTKTSLSEQQDIHLIHIYEDDWIYKQEIIKSRILNLLGKSESIYGRKTSLLEVSYKDSEEFLESNHIQGNCVNKYRIGLYYKDDLVSLMTFGKLRKNLGSCSKEGEYELLRFCNKKGTNVIGGASKLFKYFINTYKTTKIISYADRSWTMNNDNTIYDKLRFKKEYITKPNYYYINNDMRENRFKYRKDVLIKEGFDLNKTEHKIMLDREIYRIYDSGQIKYSLEI